LPRPVRVLHVVLDLQAGGLERLVREMVRLSDAARVESQVLALRFLGREARGLEQWARLHCAGPSGRLSLVRPAAVARQIASIAPDVVHSHSGVWFKAARAARMAKVPLLVHTEHGRPDPDRWDARFLDRLGARLTDVVVAVSGPLAATLAERHIARPDQIRVVENGVDTQMLRPGADDGVLRRQLGIAPNTPIIGSLGRFDFVKGYDIVIRAFSALVRSWTGVQQPVLVVAGEGGERERLERLVAELGVRGSVHLVDWRDDVAATYRAFQLFTLGSRSEGTSMSLLEAMATGVCPVVTDVGGNCDVLGPDLSHLLVPPSDPEALAAAWRDVLTDRERTARDAARARSRVVERFDMRSVVAAYEAMYLGGSLPSAATMR
jgi:glycosyltransferase involved in cell wall biosynthesis